MSLTILQARNEALTLVKDGVHGIIEYIAWEGTVADKPPDSPQVPWIRVGMRHGFRQQTSLADSSSKRVFTSSGLLSIALFTPIQGGFKATDPLATTCRNCVEGVSTPNGVWFRNARIIEIGLDGSWWRTDVLADFEYDEIK